jgi:predicted GH43/DUF377 family glycosyl hydrolase
MSKRELFSRHSANPILTPERWPYPANTVFNAAAALHDGETALLVRVEDRRGISHLTVARSKDGVSGWAVDSAPAMEPSADHPEEVWGVEDPRLTWLEDEKCFVVAYTAYSEVGPQVALARTKDLRTFERIGTVLPPENKDAALFPKKIGGNYAILHRPVTRMAGGAHIWISTSPDLVHWGRHRVLLKARSGPFWDAEKIGLSAQPLETQDGWLILYHGVKNTCFGSIYRQGLALLDLETPTKVLGRSDEWIFAPVTDYERSGDVGNVVFSCGWTVVGDEVRLYYGGADTCMAIATASLQELLDSLK